MSRSLRLPRAPRRPITSLATTSEYGVLSIAALLSAITTTLYYVPSELAPGGLNGISIILNGLVGSPVGLVTLALNVPMLVLGHRYLGGRKVVVRTMYFTVLYTILIDLLTPILPAEGLSSDVLLNAIFGGILGGISGGLCFRMGSTGGGTTIASRILNVRTGIPISLASLYIDGGIIAASALVFGWESAMYAVLSVLVYGMVTDYVLEGPSMIRTATIITDHPRMVADVILNTMQRGVTSWEAEGMYTQQPRGVLFVTVTRSQVTLLRQLVLAADPKALIVIGQGHIAYGKGFKQRRGGHS